MGTVSGRMMDERSREQGFGEVRFLRPRELPSCRNLTVCMGGLLGLAQDQCEVTPYLTSGSLNR
jgi:hypothetical protein